MKWLFFGPVARATRKFLYFLLFLTLAATIVYSLSCRVFPKPPHGVYERVLITGGSLLVSKGQCKSVDLEILKQSANIAVHEMRAVWGGVLVPDYLISVSEMPVYMAVNPSAMGTLANGIYWPQGRWIELRCDKEFVVQHELQHAIAHQLGVWCYVGMGCGVPGHLYDLDCSSC